VTPPKNSSPRLAQKAAVDSKAKPRPAAAAGAPSPWILKDDPKHSSNAPKSSGGVLKRMTKLIQSFFKRGS
jgi:hypothetical protein